MGDTWEWDGRFWIQVADSGPAPRGRHAMAYVRTDLIIWILALAANLLLLTGLAYYIIRAKRWLWSEINKLRGQQEELQRQLVAARKQIVLKNLGGDLRLPTMMPSQNGEDVLIYDVEGAEL